MNELSKLERAVGSFLGAAVGDSMGWPNEDRAHHIRRLDKQVVESGFSTWFRRRGWMAQTFEEPVHAGEYSDDTQLRALRVFVVNPIHEDRIRRVIDSVIGYCRS